MLAATVGARPANANFSTSLAGYCNRAANTYCTADSYRHNWDADLGPRFTNATLDSLYNTYDTTQLVISVGGDLNDGDHTASVDLYFEYGSVPGGWAITDCISPVNTSHACDHNHIVFEASEIVGAINDDVFLKKVACHEIAHSVGVTHPADDPHGLDPTNAFFGCIRPGALLSPNLGGHGAGHVDTYYYPF